MAEYKICEKCGASLDPGEICDCGREERPDAACEANRKKRGAPGSRGLRRERREIPGGGVRPNGGSFAESDGLGPVAEGAERDNAAIRAAVEAEVFISLEKVRGSETFRRELKASSAPAALNGLAVLIREYAKMVGMRQTEVLAVLAAVMTVPAMNEKREGNIHAAS